MFNKRILAFGCSHTYGWGLSKNTDEPSQHAWPNVLAKMVKFPVLNFSKPGASNKFIWHSLMNTNIKDDDIVLVMWTYPHRTCIIEDLDFDKSFKHMSINDTDNASKTYYKELYNDIDSGIETWSRIDHANRFHQGKNIINTICTRDLNISQPHWCNTIIHCPTLFNQIENMYPKAEDGVHAGKQAHQEFAGKFLAYMQQTQPTLFKKEQTYGPD
jgi:lysophospholipase L1-like esterase